MQSIIKNIRQTFINPIYLHCLIHFILLNYTKGGELTL